MVSRMAPSLRTQKKKSYSHKICSVLTATRFFPSVLDRNIFIRYNMFIGSYDRRNYE